MKILIINCSPVRNGATAEIVRIVSDSVRAGNEVKCVCIDDYQIALCRGCRICHATAECFQKDDVSGLMAEYEWADRIVSVSPSYWADVPGQFKVFIDRCTPLPYRRDGRASGRAAGQLLLPLDPYRLAHRPCDFQEEGKSMTKLKRLPLL